MTVSFTQINGTAIAYEVTGEGPPLLLLNGVMMTMQSWALQVPRLSARFRCVLHDVRGQLRSGKPGAYTLAQHVADLRALLDLLGIERADVPALRTGARSGCSSPPCSAAPPAPRRMLRPLSLLAVCGTGRTAAG